MNFQNHTPFAALSWDTVQSEDRWSVTSIARVKYDLVQSDSKNKFELVFSKDQEELFDTDVYYDEVGKSSVQYESDYIAFKPTTDIVINANAISANKDGDKLWQTCVKVYNEKGNNVIDYALEIKSKKIYHKAGIIWTPTIRKKEKIIPIIYEKAYGGSIQNKKEEHVYTSMYNPIGCGIKKIKDAKEYINSVQIKYLNNKEKNIPPGYGFIDKSWQSRVDYLPNYNDEWLENIHPLPPKDFNEYYYQAANPNLILNSYIKDGFRFEFENLKVNNDKFYFILEKLELIAKLKTNLKDYYDKMQIDTIIVDISNNDESKHCVYVSYRTRIPKRFEVLESSIILLNT